MKILVFGLATLGLLTTSTSFSQNTSPDGPMHEFNAAIDSENPALADQALNPLASPDRTVEERNGKFHKIPTENGCDVVGDWTFTKLSWSGKCAHGLASGFGELSSSDGHRQYAGMMDRGMLNGWGTLSLKKGSLLYSAFQNNVPTGPVVITTPGGSRYIGGWSGRREGMGVQTYTGSPGRYAGFWAHGFRSGYGVLAFDNGRKYVGEFEHGTYNGLGFLVDVDGDKYEGEWKNGLMNGYGTIVSHAGVIYRGNLKNGMRSGQGTLTLPNGARFVGSWGDDVPNGDGTFETGDGKRVTGNWIQGCLIKDNKVIASAGREIHCSER